MPNFDIMKVNTPDITYRVAKVQADYDVKLEHSCEHFVGSIDIPDDDKWHIGLIVGGSGTGKSTIAKELFPDIYVNGYHYTHKSVIDDMPCDNVNQIEMMFYAVGFGSVPSWLKPYEVLSEGEKMRVDLARAMLSSDRVCFDEFTSVIDRQVARTACIAIKKAIMKNNMHFIAVSCHRDIIEWLQPDWVFDTATMKTNFPSAHERKKNMLSKNVGEMNGSNLAVIII